MTLLLIVLAVVVVWVVIAYKATDKMIRDDEGR